jgi:arylsulfatase A-like enzyme
MRFSQRPSRSAILLAVIYSALDTGAADRPKNLVSILTDTHSAWTLGCYGNPDIHTPHIDRLAQEGVRFTWALSSKPVCSPNRATFLTGLMPSQHGVHSFLDPKFLMGPAAYNSLSEVSSLGEVLRDAGNTCGLSGKWHCGDNLRPSEGFSFWVTKPDGHTNELCNQDVIEIGAARPETGYTTDLWMRKGIEFIEQNQTRPFFLFLAYDGPYVLGGLMRNAPRNRRTEFYRGKNFRAFRWRRCTRGSRRTRRFTTRSSRGSARPRR